MTASSVRREEGNGRGAPLPSPLGRQATRGTNVRKGVYGQVLKRSPYQRNNLHHRTVVEERDGADNLSIP